MAKNYWNGTPPVSLEQAAAVPYATIGIKIGDGPQVMFVLATDSGDHLMWVAGQSAAIETRNGRIIRTSGLEHDLSGSWSGSGLDASAGDSWLRPARDVWVADFVDRKQYSVQITCSHAAPVSDPVTLLGKTIATVRVDESCDAPQLEWSFANSFWVDPATGVVWRSIQHTSPDLDPLEIDVLRPPG
jgi:hypothetical protein